MFSWKNITKKMKNKNNKKAFTLMEALIAIGIIAIIGSIIVANYKVSSNQVSLYNFQQALYQDIGLAKWKAIDLSSYNDEIPVYWGISLEEGSSSYTMFADLNGNGEIDAGESDPLLGAKTKEAGADTYISNINLASTSLNILFPVDGDFVVFYDVGSGLEVFGEAEIELKSAGSDIGKIISVNSFSLIENFDCFCTPSADHQCSFCP
jgi:Tfp pilus assembly protein FimT